jgi:hypothetical protein
MMRRSYLLHLLFVVPLAGLLAACSPAEPRIAVETTRLDLGDVPNGAVAARDVVVRNEGDSLLVVEAITTSCGCTTATLVPMQLEPGASGALHIEFDAGAHGPALRGALLREVFINSNDAARPEVSIELTATITDPPVGDEP